MVSNTTRQAAQDAQRILANISNLGASVVSIEEQMERIGEQMFQAETANSSLHYSPPRFRKSPMLKLLVDRWRLRHCR